MEKKINYTWESFGADIKQLASSLKNLEHLKNIYGIPRGGLILAVALSHDLKLPLILDKKDITKQTLIVDDIVDSGKTLEQLPQECKTCTIASLWSEEKTPKKPDYFVHTKTDAWIIFPWETNSSSEYDGTMQDI